MPSKKGGKADMYYEGGFVGGIAPGDIEQGPQDPGTTIDFFDFPTFGGEDAGPRSVATCIAALTDKPGVKEFMTT